MKWIGQHIVELIARFKSDVYLESISTGTIASGNNLGLDSNNKIVKAVEATGDITSVVAGAGLTGGGTSGDVTLSVPTASDLTKGIVELATTDETTTGTDTGRVVTPDGLKDGYQGSTNVTTLGTIGTGVWNGTKLTDIYTNTSGRRYDSTIKILPTDFIQNEDGGVNKSQQFDDNGTIGVRATSTNAELWCFPSIPQGMKATHVHIKGLDSGVDGSSADDYAIEVHEYSLSTGAITSKGTGVVGTNLAITEVSSSATNCLAIRVDTADIDGSDTDVVYGGYVTIAEI